DVIFGVLLDDLGHFSIMRKTSDNARLSAVLYRRHGVRFMEISVVETAHLVYAALHGFAHSCCPDYIGLVASSAKLDAAAWP
ncbi:hypothetical protein, partial [Agrobacterium pusense]|uniref:hypothetical protein n=1 Tax=Agrobacterium pusense TaxID=648995 RepID=UPI001AEC9208